MVEYGPTKEYIGEGPFQRFGRSLRFFIRQTFAPPEQMAGCSKAGLDISDTAIDSAKSEDRSRANKYKKPPKKGKTTRRKTFWEQPPD